LIGTADSATEEIAGSRQREARPSLRPAGVLETVPSPTVTQHSGDGKANRYFLRGFNPDHGTDVRSTLAGVAVNLPGHGHGQGYADRNFPIPELIERLE
jgi:outer membrane cobalamin receptor